MSSFRANLQKAPVKSSRRFWIEAIVVGIVAEGLLAGVLMLLGNPSAFGPLFVFVIAAVLGWRYGSLRGAVATVVPIGLFIVAEVVREALGGTGGAGAVQTIVIGVAAALMIGFVALFTGAIRKRYRPLPTA
ncbi:MAG: hypothetical protein WCN97_02850 [Thermoleophilia bacterium]|jgi:hypothetical protein